MVVLFVASLFLLVATETTESDRVVLVWVRCIGVIFVRDRFLDSREMPKSSWLDPTSLSVFRSLAFDSGHYRIKFISTDTNIDSWNIQHNCRTTALTEVYSEALGCLNPPRALVLQALVRSVSLGPIEQCLA
jgi:hypothetical protein